MRGHGWGVKICDFGRGSQKILMYIARLRDFNVQYIEKIFLHLLQKKQLNFETYLG